MEFLPEVHLEYPGVLQLINTALEAYDILEIDFIENFILLEIILLRKNHKPYMNIYYMY